MVRFKIAPKIIECADGEMEWKQEEDTPPTSPEPSPEPIPEKELKKQRRKKEAVKRWRKIQKFGKNYSRKKDGKNGKLTDILGGKI